MPRKQSVFTIAIKSRPKPTQNSLVFHYDYNLLDFNTTSFNPASFQGAYLLTEIEELKQALRARVNFYEIHPDKTEELVNCVMCCCCILSFVFLPAILLFLGAGILCLTCIGGIFRKSLMKRERQIQKVLSETNQKIAGRGFSWMTGKYGAYLILSRDPSRALGGQIPLLIDNIPRNVLNPPESRIPIAQPINQAGIAPYGAPNNINYPGTNQDHRIGLGEDAGQGADLGGFIEIDVPGEKAKL